MNWKMYQQIKSIQAENVSFCGNNYAVTAMSINML